MNDTIDFYNINANDYFDRTVNGDMKLEYELFLKHIKRNGYILDYGCGSGRDSKYFIENGYKVKAIDASKSLCDLATSYIGQPVYNMTFNELTDINTFDGIWACASLLHIPENELLKVFYLMIYSLKVDGIIYIALKNGIGSETINGRFFNYYTEEHFQKIISSYPELKLLETHKNISITNPHETKYWNSYILKKKI